MVEVREIKILPPNDYLEPCLLVECKIETPFTQCVVEVKGLVLTPDGKIISRLEEVPKFSNEVEGIGLYASENAAYKELQSSTQGSTYRFIAPLSPYAIDHIEKLREEKKSPADVEFKFRFVLKYLESNVVTSHLHEVPTDALPTLKRELADYLANYNSRLGNPYGINPSASKSLIIYSYNPEFRASRSNMYILSANTEPKFLFFKKVEKDLHSTISYTNWINDFLPKLKRYTRMIIEVPQFESTPVYEHLAKAVEELKYAEQSLREGKYDTVILSLRNILLNHLTKLEGGKRILNPDLKNAIINDHIPSNLKKVYDKILDVVGIILGKLVHKYLSKFIHTDTGELLNMPLKADAEYLFLTITSIVRYLSRLLEIQKGNI